MLVHTPQQPALGSSSAALVCSLHVLITHPDRICLVGCQLNHKPAQIHDPHGRSKRMPPPLDMHMRKLMHVHCTSPHVHRMGLHQCNRACSISRQAHPAGPGQRRAAGRR